MPEKKPRFISANCDSAHCTDEERDGQNWSPGRISRLMADIERNVFILELADKADNEARNRGKVTARKPNSESGLAIIDILNDEGP